MRVCETEVKNLNRKGKRNKEKGRRHSTDPRVALLSWDSFQAETKRQDIVWFKCAPGQGSLVQRQEYEDVGQGRQMVCEKKERGHLSENGAAISEKSFDVACQTCRHSICHGSFSSIHSTVVLVTNRVMTPTAIQHSYDSRLSGKVNSIVYPNIKILPIVYSPHIIQSFFFSLKMPDEYNV